MPSSVKESSFKDNMIIIIPHEGLGNRMRAMLAAYQWSRDMDARVHFLWIREANLNCRFDRLFQPLSELTELPSIFRRVWHFFLRFKRPLGILGVKVFNDLDYNEFSEYMRNGKKDWLVLSSTFSKFYENDNKPDYRDIFHLTRQLEKKVDDICWKFETNTIGIHIRRTDNREAIECSPLEAFVERMDETIQTSPDTRFFLATDSGGVLSDLQRRYGDRIICHNSKLERTSEQGIMDAVVELYALSRCKSIWGSYYSSFSELAASLGRIPLEIILKYSHL